MPVVVGASCPDAGGIGAVRWGGCFAWAGRVEIGAVMSADSVGASVVVRSGKGAVSVVLSPVPVSCP